MLETLTTSSGRDPSHAAPRTEGLGLPHPAWRGDRETRPASRPQPPPQGLPRPLPRLLSGFSGSGSRGRYRRASGWIPSAAPAPAPAPCHGRGRQPGRGDGPRGPASRRGLQLLRPPPPSAAASTPTLHNPPETSAGHLESGTGEPPGSGPDALRQRWLRAQRLLHYQQLPETPGDGPALTGGALGGPPRNRGPCGGWGDLPMTSRRTNSSENEGRVGAGTERTEAESPVGSPGGREDL